MRIASTLARVLALALALAAAPGCRTEPLPGAFPDGAGAADGAVADAGTDGPAPDAAISCGALSSAVGAFIEDPANAACRADAECALAWTRCGLPGTCGAYVRRDATGKLQSLVDAWAGRGCGDAIACAACEAPDPAACIDGRCSPRSASCDAIAAEVSRRLTSDRACMVDSECAVASTDCGLPGVCGAPLRKDKIGDVSRLVAEWRQRGCGDGQPCPDCFPRDQAVCRGGQCDWP